MATPNDASNRRAAVTVRGVCAAGHVTERTPEARRVTWRGPCSHEGCDLEVHARRVPAQRAAETPAPEPNDAGTPGPTVKEVSYAQPTPKRQQRRPDPGPEREPEPAAGPDPDEPVVQRPAQPGHVDPGPDGAPVVDRSRRTRRGRPARPRVAFRSPLEW